MTQINIIGPAFSCSGYDSHCRQLANALSKLVDVRLSTQLSPGVEKIITDRELEMIKRKPTKDEINLIITNPAGWLVNLNAKKNWVYLIWEGDKIPKWIIEQCLDKRIEKILVASNHTINALSNTEGFFGSGIAEKLVLVPHGVDLEKFYPKEKPKKLTFILNKGFKNLEDRGGVQYFLKAYLEEFSKADNVEAIIKINPSYGIPNLDNVIKQLTNKTEPEMPVLKFDLNFYDYKDLVKLYNSGNVFVSPTRAEAYNLGCIEACACGLPVITTNFGGQTDFINESNGWIIPGILEEVKHELLYEGIKWLTPNVEQLRKVMRDIYINAEQIEQKAFIARQTALENTWDMTAEKIAKLL
jgi:glycosyltransferase involved in cell wall biosynthesis